MILVKTLLGCLVVIGPLHMIEQLICGIDEIYELKRFLVPYYARFENPDYGTVILVTLGGAFFFAIAYMIEAKGIARRVAVLAIALLCVGEIHHVVKGVAHARYNPGLVTAVPFFLVGVLLILAVLRESREQSSRIAQAA